MRRMMTGLLLSLFGAAAALAAQEMAVKETSGVVEAKLPGANMWLPVRAGQIIQPDTLLSTGFNSGARIVAGDAVLTMHPLTRIHTAESSSPQGDTPQGGVRVEITLHAGRIRVDAETNVALIVRASASVVSGMSAGFAFDFDGAYVRVYEGRVHIAGGERAGAYVGAGQRVTVNADTGRIGSAAETAQKELAPALPIGLDEAPQKKPEIPVYGTLAVSVGWD